MYYRAKKLALNNNHPFHVVAVLKRGKSVIRIGTNSEKTTPRFARRRANGSVDYHFHAETNVLRFAKPGDVVYVLRFSKSGILTMAKPCEFCQIFLAEAGIKKVYYSDWEGQFKKMLL